MDTNDVEEVDCDQFVEAVIEEKDPVLPRLQSAEDPNAKTHPKRLGGPARNDFPQAKDGQITKWEIPHVRVAQVHSVTNVCHHDKARDDKEEKKKPCAVGRPQSKNPADREN